MAGFQVIFYGRFWVITEGLTIGGALGAYAFYLTSHHQIGNEALFLVLCPPSIGALALDNAGLLGGIIGWIITSIENAALYAAVGFVVGAIAPKSK